MQIIIRYDKKQYSNGNWLSRNLYYMTISLDKNLRRRHQAHSVPFFDNGSVIIDVVGADQATTAPYIEAFHKAAVREGYRLTVSYDSHTH